MTSGIFIAKLSRSDNLNLSSHIYFIVRDDNRSADVIQTSDATWQAYNLYGGYSLYCACSRSTATRVRYAIVRPAPAKSVTTVRSTRATTIRELHVQRRVSDGALAGSERLRRQGLGRAWNRPPGADLGAYHASTERIRLGRATTRTWSATQ